MITAQTVGGETLNASTVAFLKTRRNGQAFPVVKEWVYANWAALESEDLEYTQQGSISVGLPSSCTTNGGDYFGIVIVGGPASAAFEFEFIAHCEVRGGASEAASTPNHAVEAEIVESIAASAMDAIASPFPTAMPSASAQSTAKVVSRGLRSVKAPGSARVAQGILQAAGDFFGDVASGAERGMGKLLNAFENLGTGSQSRKPYGGLGEMDFAM